MAEKRPNNVRAPDYCSQANATLLAARIADYWSKRGHPTCVWTEPLALGATGYARNMHAVQRAWWQVRSNMVGGLPRGDG